MLSNIIKSHVMADVLGLILFKDNLHLRDIARITKHSVSAVKKESDFLVNLGVIIPKKVGNIILFSQNRSHALFEPLQQLFLNTDGFIYQLKQRLQNSVDFAFVFGSFANAKYNNESDIDFLVIVKNDKVKITKKIFDVQKRTNFPINLVAYTSQEFNKAKKTNSFLKNIIKSDKMWVVGDEIGFRRFVKSTSNS